MPEGKTTEWKSQALRAYQRRTLAADALIASTYLSYQYAPGAACADGAVWRRRWQGHGEPDVAQGEERLGRLEWPLACRGADCAAHSRRHAVRVRLDRKATSISLLVVLGVRATARRCCSRSKAWEERAPRRGAPSSTISSRADCGGRSSSSSTARRASTRRLLPSGPVCPCRPHRPQAQKPVAHAPKRLHDEITADYTDVIYAPTREEIETRRKAFIRKWRLKHRAVADSLEEAGERLFAFTRLPPTQWRSVRTTNAIERLHEEFKRRIKTQTVLPSADTAAICRSGRCLHPVRSTCARSTAGKRSPPNQSISRLTSPPETIPSYDRRARHTNSNHIP